MLEHVKERKRALFVPFILSEGNFFVFVFYLNVLNALSEYFRIYITYHKIL